MKTPRTSAPKLVCISNQLLDRDASKKVKYLDIVRISAAG
jgi:hypothetical protein